MDYEQKHQEDLEAAKGWLAIAKENNNTIAIQILENLFPELKESEDEKIRKELIQYLEDYPNLPNGNYCRNDFFAWLEKQGEQNPTEDVDLPEFESYLCLMLQKFRTKGMCTNGEIIDYVEEHSQKLRDILVRPTWSKEDEEKFRDVIRLVEQGAPVQSIRDHYTNWLKSLKDRFQLQPKQEWSEEDEKRINHGRQSTTNQGGEK